MVDIKVIIKFEGILIETSTPESTTKLSLNSTPGNIYLSAPSRQFSTIK